QRKEEHADGRDQRRERKGAGQRGVGDALDRPVDEGGEQHGDDEHDQERNHERADAEPGGQEQQCNERNEGRHHEHVAMGEIHHADDAEHHRVADGNETVDRTERDAVDELLGEDFHARAPDAEASPTIRQPVKLYQGAARPATAATLLPRALWAEEAWWGERARTKVPRVRCRTDHRTEDKSGTLPVAMASWRADPDSAVDLGVRRASLSRRCGVWRAPWARLSGPLGR